MMVAVGTTSNVPSSAVPGSSVPSTSQAVDKDLDVALDGAMVHVSSSITEEAILSEILKWFSP
jgi:surface antigen